MTQNKDAMKKFISIIRVSTKEQAEKRLGLDSQTQAIENYVKSVSGTLIQTFEEHVSGNFREQIVGNVNLQTLLKKRPEFLKAVEACQKTGATLIAKEASRISRSPLVIEFLINSGVNFIVADSPEDTPLILRIKSAINQDELNKISERTSSALQQRKKQLLEKGSFISKSGKVCTSLGKNNFAEYNKQPRTRQSKYEQVRGYIKSLRQNNLPFSAISERLKSEGYPKLSTSMVYRLAV